MLILTRRPGQSIKIGEDIEVAVIGVHGSQVRIGIRAPKQVAVDREEITLRKLAHPLSPIKTLGRA